MKRQVVWRSCRQTVTAANPVQDVDSPGKAGLPSFPGGRLPEPESAARKLVIRSVGLLAIVASLAYLLWRALFTIDLGVWWASIPLFGLEAYALFSLALFAFSLWDVGSVRPARPVNTSAARIAVLIPTYNESREVLLPTVAAAVALRLDHDTWVLDDGSRPAVKQLAGELGARYLARPQHKDAKAGNINHALSVVDADFIAILDADHVASPDFLTNTLGYFDDPRVALVQTPQDFCVCQPKTAPL
jgi:cellulose synthase (UDP-forming)